MEDGRGRPPRRSVAQAIYAGVNIGSQGTKRVDGSAHRQALETPLPQRAFTAMAEVVRLAESLKKRLAELREIVHPVGVTGFQLRRRILVAVFAVALQGPFHCAGLTLPVTLMRGFLIVQLLSVESHKPLHFIEGRSHPPCRRKVHFYSRDL